jgi:glucodextranase-like protein
VRESARAYRSVGAALIVALGMAACSGSGENEQGAETTPTPSNVTVQITAPADGSSLQADRVTVRGTVDPPDADVQIIGKSAQVGNGIFTASVALKRGSNTIDVVASAEGAAPASETITVIRPAPRPAKRVRSRTTRGGVVPLASATNCGDGLTAGARTSCPFAENVRAAYEQSGAGVLEVHSPTTRQTYRMYCTSGSPHVCTGGTGASVYFADRGVVTRYETDTCGGDLVVGPNTSCAFADNVQAEYYRSGPGWINVYSPTTGRTYDMYCTGSSPHVCTGGNDAAVYFP